MWSISGYMHTASNLSLSTVFRGKLICLLMLLGVIIIRRISARFWLRVKFKTLWLFGIWDKEKHNHQFYYLLLSYYYIIFIYYILIFKVT